MNKLLGRSKLFLNRNASTMLTVAGGIGVIATSIMAVKATPKALQLLEEAKEEKGEELTKLEAVKVAGPAYIPAAIVGASTIACVFGANILNKRHQASIVSAYALLDQSYKEYKKKTLELFGEDAEDRIVREIAKDKYDEEDIDIPEDDGKQLFYDYFSDRYFRATLVDVLRAESAVNKKLMNEDYAYVNDFYEALDIEPIESGYEYGWSTGANMDRYWQSWVDFTHEKVPLEDGMECTIVQMRGEPIFGFANYV